jgi:hypothetical protein
MPNFHSELVNGRTISLEVDVIHNYQNNALYGLARVSHASQ